MIRRGFYTKHSNGALILEFAWAEMRAIVQVLKKTDTDQQNEKQEIMGVTSSQILEKAGKEVWRSRKPLIKALLIPLLATYSLSWIPAHDFLILDVIHWLVSLALHAIVCIVIHRILLLGADSVAEWGIQSPTNREWRFFWYLVLFLSLGQFAALAYKYDALSANQIGVFNLFAIIPVYIFARLSLVLPATALELSGGLADAWRQSRVLPIFVTLMLIPMIFAWLCFYLQYFLYPGEAGQVLNNLIWPIILVYEIAILSMLYSAVPLEDDELA